jgi:Dolichyl-phosphate-mannose-protein mannosyltransferase
MLLLFKEPTFNKFNQKFADFPWLQALFSIGALLRISGFTVGIIWYDELFSLEMTRQNLFEMINALKANLSPPGWETLLWFVVRIFGWNAFSLRLLSVIASTATLWVVYKIGIALKFTRGQLIATMAIAALLPYQLISAQQGRVYALFSMLYLLGLYAALSKRWLVLGISAAALFWCHNISFIFVPALFIIAIFVHPQNWKRVILVLILSVLAYIPWLGVTLTQTATPIAGYPTLDYSSFVFNFLIALFGFDMSRVLVTMVFTELFILLGIVIFHLISWIYRDLRKNITALGANRICIRNWVASLVASKIEAGNPLLHRWSKWILFFAFAIPLALFLLAGMVVQNVVMYRTLYPLTIPFVMWLIAIYVVPRPNILHIIVYGISVLVLITAVINWSPSQDGGDFENLNYIIERGFKHRYVSIPGDISSFQPGDAFFHDTGWTALVFKYYFPDKPDYLMDGNDVWGLGDVQLNKAQIKQAAPEQILAQRLWVVWARSHIIEKINKTADERTYQLIIKYNCPIISGFYYSQAFYVEVYLCDLHQK